MKTQLASRPLLGLFIGLGLAQLGCNAILDIRPGREICGVKAPLCDDPTVAHWDPSAPREYTVGDELVCDEVTGLEWARAPSAEELSLEEATEHCRALSADGRTGFRLPTRIELLSLVDYSLSLPAMAGEAFDAPPETLWSSSQSVGFAGQHLSVNFADGQVVREDLSMSPRHRVRCVRREGEETAPTCGDPDCVNGRYCWTNVAMKDVETGLEWQVGIRAEGSGVSLDDARQRCEELDLLGGGWRLPRVEELQTLVEDTLDADEAIGADGAIDRDAFPDDEIYTYFWSASDYARDDTKAWTVSFVDGALFAFGKEQQAEGADLLSSRCVRSAP